MKPYGSTLIISPSVFLLAFGVLGPFAHAASIAVQVVNATGQAVTDAVVYAEMDTPRVAPKPTRPIEIEQRDRKFLPLVSVIQAGTEVSFPNNDSVRHHIYSFSEPKKFEQKLYSGIAASPVMFDKPGTVVLGCNIHDKMLAYIYIVDTAHFAKTDATGSAKLSGLASGKYHIKAWHFNLPPGDTIVTQTLKIDGDAQKLTIKLNLKPALAIAQTQPPATEQKY